VVAFCHGVGLDDVSRSPPRAPVARLADAHAAFDDPGPLAVVPVDLLLADAAVGETAVAGALGYFD
jgi:hypothetical protein